MGKILKKLISLVIAVLIAFGALSYGLSPSEPIKNENRLCNVDERIDVSAINKDVIKGAKIEGDKLKVDMVFNNYVFNKILKYNLMKYGNQDMEAFEFKLEGEELVVMIPQKIGPFKSQVNVYMKFGSSKDKLVLTIDKVLLGKIKIPNSIISSKIEEMSRKTDRITAEKNNILVDFNSVDMGIRNMRIEDGKMKYQIIVTKDDVEKIGINLIDNMFDF